MEHNTSPKSQSGQKHIVLFISALRKGGAERVMVNLADYLHRNGVRVTLVTQYEKENEYPLPTGADRILSDLAPEEEGNRIQNLLPPSFLFSALITPF